MDSTDARLAEAKTLLASGRIQDALPLMKAAYADVADPVQRADISAFLGVALGRAGDRDASEHWFELARNEAAQPSAITFELGQMRLQCGDEEGAMAAFLEALHEGSRNARHFLAAGFLLDRRGRKDDALAVWSLGNDMDPMLTRAFNHPQADEQTKAMSRQADQKLRSHFSSLHRESVKACDDADERGRILNAIWTMTHDAPFEYISEMHQPQMFFIPELEAQPVYTRDELAWMSLLEKATDAILSEYLSATASGAKGDPYVHARTMRGEAWDQLRGQDRWEAIHLYKNGERQPFADQFSETLSALEHVPLVQPDGQPLEVFFSVLKPGTHIPPHFGLANSRLTVHLPLIVPQDCAIRVGDATHVWQQGKVFAFDDSFEHEAWNRSSETRVVLIFEAWSPNLSNVEREAITASFEARMAWLSKRSVPRPGHREAAKLKGPQGSVPR